MYNPHVLTNGMQTIYLYTTDRLQQFFVVNRKLIYNIKYTLINRYLHPPPKNKHEI